MKITRLKDKLLLGALAIAVLVALVSMLAVAWVISQQHQDQSNALLRKASRVIDGSLESRKEDVLTASRQLATQKNIGATVWYLSKYARTDTGHETLFNTYQQLAKETFKAGRAAKLDKIAVYDSAGNLVAFALFGGSGDRVGFVERPPVPVFLVATLTGGEELNRNNLLRMDSVPSMDVDFGRRMPQQDSVHYAIVDGVLAIESYVPVMGEVFDQGTGKREIKQLGLVVSVQSLGQSFVEHLVWLSDVKINFFTLQGFNSGDLPDYRSPDWGGAQAGTDVHSPVLTFNEISIGGRGYYQCLMPLYADHRLVGSIAALQSKEVARRNTMQMLETLGLIAAASLLLILPFAWYFAASISRPLTLLSKVFRDVAGGQHAEALGAELTELEKQNRRPDELGDLTRSFLAMNDAINQQIRQIHEINASLENKVQLRTRELRSANEELTKLAMHDALTGLPNRKLLTDRLQQALAIAKRDKVRLALIFIDLDEFKPVNDMHGHSIGDLLLQEAARRIQGCLRESDSVSRIGGDEFVVLLPIIDAEQDASMVAEKICHAVNQPFELSGVSVHISSSIGIALYPEHGSDETTLCKHADAAMYSAKEGGRNTVRMFAAPDL